MARPLALALALAAAPAAAATYDVGRYESPGVGPVNTWWIETPGRGLVVVDAQRDPKSAAAAIARIRATKLPVRAIVLTHPHPDHVTGLAQFKRAFPEAPVHAGRGTQDELKANRSGLLGAEGSPRPPLADHVVEGPFTVDGLRLEPRELGPGEAAGHTVYWLPQMRALVSGDIATPSLTPFLAEGRTRAWLANLDTLRASYPAGARLLPGHGGPGPLKQMADGQTRYLEAFRAEVRRAMQPGSLDGAAVVSDESAGLTRAMARRFRTRGQVAGLPPSTLERMNTEGVVKELAAER